MSTTNKTKFKPSFFKKFIKAYCKFPVLWQIGSTDYYERKRQHKAWNLLLRFTRRKYPDVDLLFVKKKVRALRKSFAKELIRIRNRKRSASGNAVYKLPSLWYFNMLLLKDQENIWKSKSNINEKIKDEETENVDESELKSTVNIDSTVSAETEVNNNKNIAYITITKITKNALNFKEFIAIKNRAGEYKDFF